MSRRCRIAGCTGKHWAYGLCTTHGGRFRDHGDPEWTQLREVDEIAVERAVRGDRPDKLTTGEREEAVRRLWLQGLTDGLIAEHLDIGLSGVWTIRTRLGLPAVAA